MDEQNLTMIMAAITILIPMAQAAPGKEFKLQQLNVKNEQGELENFEITVKKI